MTALAAQLLLPVAMFIVQEVELLSVEAYGQPGEASIDEVSPDGRWVTMRSSSEVLCNVPVPEGSRQALLLDRVTRTFECVSVNDLGEASDGRANEVALSGDGSLVIFTSDALNLADDPRGADQLYARNRQTGVTTRILDDATGGPVDQDVARIRLSRDGRFVVFQTQASDLTVSPGNGLMHVYLLDLQTQALTLVSSSEGGTPANGDSFDPVFSGDGSTVAFRSIADNLVTGDSPDLYDGFCFERLTGELSIVSLGSLGQTSNRSVAVTAISNDGRFVAFTTDDPSFVPGKTTPFRDAYIRDRNAGTTTRVGIGPGGLEPNGGSFVTALSDDGRYALLGSSATNLIPDETYGVTQAWIWDAVTGELQIVGRGVGGALPDQFVSVLRMSADGQLVFLQTSADNLLPCTDALESVYLVDRAGRSSWTLECDGWPGAEGLPRLSLSDAPAPCTTPLVRIESSSGFPAIGSAILSTARLQAATPFGGTLLVRPDILLPVGLSPGINAIPVTIPCDWGVLGREIFLQVIQVDPGASEGISFTRRLRFHVGS